MSVGERINKIRKAQGLTIKDTAIMAGVTPSLISQIENDKANPSLATLVAIAGALNADVVSFFDSSEAADAGPVVRANAGLTTFDSPAWTQVTLTEIDLKKFYVCFLRMGEGANSDNYPELNPQGLAAYEFGYVLTGKLQVMLEDKIYILNPGDSISFEASKKHTLSNALPSETTLLWAMIFA